MPDQTAPDAPADELDLDAWLDDLELPETTVTVYAKASLLDRHQQLNNELRLAHLRQENRRTRAAEDSGDDERTLGDDDAAQDDEEVASLSAQIDENYQAMKSSGRTFRIRALTQERYDQVVKAHRGSDGTMDNQAFAIAGVAAALVPPTTVEAVMKLRAHLPVGEFQKFTNALNQVTSGSVDLPL